MNISFDAKRAFLNKSGLGNYSRTLIKSLVHCFPDNKYTLFTTQKSGSPFTDFISANQNCNIIEPESFIAKKLPSLWRTFEVTGQLTKNNSDVYHGLSNELPLNINKFKGKKIVTIHDLIFLRYPELYSLIDVEIYDRKFRNACKNADCIIAISDQTKSDLIKYFRIPEKKIRVVYQSCDEIYSNQPTEDDLKRVKEKYNLPHQYLLSVGTIEERKNLLLLVKALNLIKDIKLVVVGKKGKYFKKVNEFILENKLESRVLFMDNVETEDLPAFYHQAEIFIYPSLFEGFGIPILEAITCKTPVVAAHSSSLLEVGGKNSLYFDPANFSQLAEFVNNVLRSPTLRKTMREKGFEHAQKFKPEVVTQELIKIYTQ